jgi:AcrR family transcriptional regulator
MAELDPTWNASLAFREAMDPVVTAPRATPAEAFRVARDRFVRGDRIDMVAIAADLHIARATLYRWTGDRDQLLADVISAELLEIVGYADRTAEGRGCRRLEQMIGAFLDIVAGSPALRALIAHEGASGVLMLTSPTGPIRPRIVQTLTQIIRRECEDGGYRPPADPQILADGIVSLGERYLHNGGDPTLNPDPATAKTIVALLLREPT